MRRITVILLLFAALWSVAQASNSRRRLLLARATATAAAECTTVSEFHHDTLGVVSASLKYYAFAVTNKPGDICAVRVLMSLHASETNIFEVAWCANNSTNRPGDVVSTSQTVTAATIGTTTNYVEYSFTAPFTPASGSTTTNWVRIAKAVDPVSGFPVFLGQGNSSVEIMVRSSNGLDWENVDLTRQPNYEIIRSP